MSFVRKVPQTGAAEGTLYNPAEPLFILLKLTPLIFVPGHLLLLLGITILPPHGNLFVVFCSSFLLDLIITLHCHCLGVVRHKEVQMTGQSPFRVQTFVTFCTENITTAVVRT